MKIPCILGVSLALAGCSAAPDLLPAETLAPAADAGAQVRHVHGATGVPGFTARPVKGPEDWRKLNDRAEQIGGPLGQLRGVDEPIRKRKRK